MPAPMLETVRWRWVLLIAVVVGAFLLRAHDVSRIFLWLDETDFFNERLFGAHPKALLDYALTTKNGTTNTMGWPAILWMSCRLFGPTLGVARAPSVLVGTAAVVLIFLLVYRLIPAAFAGSRFVPAILAAALAAIAMPQLEFSQRTYPYAAVPFAAAALLLAHLEVFRAISSSHSAGKLLRPVALYTLAGVFALFIHPSLDLLLGISAPFLTVRAAREFLWRPGANRRGFLQTVFAAGLILFCAALVNAKNPKYGHRIYLPEYYHPLSFHSIPRLAGHAYDLFTFHLNLFYNPALYWPERVNWVLLPLVLVCWFGWWLAGAGKLGAQARQLAQLGLALTGLLAVLSIVGIFPFGGVRQTLLLSPFLLAFTGLGAYALCERRATRILGTVAAAAYLAAWAYNLPRFYQERVSAYNAEDIAQVWRQNGELKIFTRAADRELQYIMRNHPEIEIRDLEPFPKPPYLLLAPHWPPLENKTFYFGFLEHLRQEGSKATLVMATPPVHLDSLQYRTSLYYPPNCAWVYKITPQ